MTCDDGPVEMAVVDGRGLAAVVGSSAVEVAQAAMNAVARIIATTKQCLLLPGGAISGGLVIAILLGLLPNDRRPAHLNSRLTAI
jgi:hypothetical protein